MEFSTFVFYADCFYSSTAVAVKHSNSTVNDSQVGSYWVHLMTPAWAAEKL